MSCQEYDDLLALFAGGELDANDEDRIEVHLATCPACRAAVGEMRSQRAVLASLAGDPVDEAVLQSVRRRVMARIEPRAHHTGAWRWAWAAAAATGAILISMAVLRRPPEQPPVSKMQGPQPSAVIPAAEMPVPSTGSSVPQTQSVIQIARVSAPPSARPIREKAAEPLVVKMITDDPDIVIYWLVDSEGEKQ